MPRRNPSDLDEGGFFLVSVAGQSAAAALLVGDAGSQSCQALYDRRVHPGGNVHALCGARALSLGRGDSAVDAALENFRERAFFWTVWSCCRSRDRLSSRRSTPAALTSLAG